MDEELNIIKSNQLPEASQEEADNGTILIITPSGDVKQADSGKMKGASGEKGKTTQFQIGTVEKTAPGDDPVVTLTDKGEDEQGNPKRAINLTLPAGETGPVPVIEIGTVTNVAPGGNPSATLVENGVTAEGVKKYKLNLVLVKGDAGAGNVDITNSGDLIKDTPYILTPNANGAQQYTAQEAVIGGRNYLKRPFVGKFMTNNNDAVNAAEIAFDEEVNSYYICKRTDNTGSDISTYHGVTLLDTTYLSADFDPSRDDIITSVWVKSNVNQTINFGYSSKIKVVTLQPGVWTRVWANVKDLGITRLPSINVSTGKIIRENKIWYRGYKVEYGQFPSDWTPAPEDKEDKINTPNGSLPYKNGSGVWEGRTVDVATSGNSIPIRTVTGQIRVANAINGNEAATLQQLTDHNTSVTAHTDIRNKIDASITAHNASGITHSDIRDKVDTVEAIARGKARARVFDTVAELDAWLAVPANVEELQVGDNFYIRAVDVPDFWWDGTTKLALEGEKVDLSDFYTKNETSARFSFKPVQKSAVLLPDDWVEVEEGWTTTVQDADLKDGCMFTSWPVDRESSDIASKAEIDENVLIEDGRFTITAKALPDRIINIIYSYIA